MIQKTQQKNKLFSWVSLLIFSGIIVFINVIGSFFVARIDMTEDERYSLSNGTIDFLKGLNKKDAAKENQIAGRMFIKVYLEGNLPADMKRFRDEVEAKLKLFRDIAGDRIEYEFIDPKAGNEAENEAMAVNLLDEGNGIIPLEMFQGNSQDAQKMTMWPGATIEYQGNTSQIIQFLPGTPPNQTTILDQSYVSSEMQAGLNNLEYNLVSAIRRTVNRVKPRIALIKGHGELEKHESVVMRTLLSDYYKLEELDLNDSISALNRFDGVIIADPKTKYSDKDLYLIDQFVMRGGRLMCFLDKLQFNKDSLIMTGVTPTIRKDLGIERLLYTYGIQVGDSYVVDANCGEVFLPVKNSKKPLYNWPYFIKAQTSKHPITKNVSQVMLRYSNELKFVPGDNYVSTPVLTSSPNSRSFLAPVLNLITAMQPRVNNNFVDNPTNENNKICLAGITEGKYTSYFKTRLPEAFTNDKSIDFLEESKREGKVMVVGNGRFYSNLFQQKMGKDSVVKYYSINFNELKCDIELLKARNQEASLPVYGNQEFIQNIVEYMMGDNSVLDIRSKQIEVREIDKQKVEENRGFYSILNMTLPSVLAVILGFSVFYFRKKRYAN